MKVSRRALDARPAQGRVGSRSRQTARLLAIHQLLSAPASDRSGPLEALRARLANSAERAGDDGGPMRSDSRRQARTTVSPPRKASRFSRVGTLARLESASANAPGPVPFRGKGVHAG